MTLYVKAVVGRASYLIAATPIRDVVPVDGPTGDQAADCRLLFGEPDNTPGYRLVVGGDASETIVLVVDRIDGLIELDDDSFRKLPPIGRFGAAIDAVSIPAGDEAPALRLVVGPSLLGGAVG